MGTRAAATRWESRKPFPAIFAHVKPSSQAQSDPPPAEFIDEFSSLWN
jgi:hypothetical protein